MATLTTAQLNVLRSYVGDQVTEVVLQERYDRLDSNLSEVVLETLRHRQAQYYNDQATSVSVDGLSVNYSQQISQIQTLIDEFVDQNGIDDDLSSASGTRVSQLDFGKLNR